MADLSVIIPTYNSRDVLQKTLSAIFDQDLARDRYEIIVLDDGSADGTGEMVKLTYHWQQNRGRAAARNAGSRIAQGRILFYLDSDVLAAPGLLSRHFQYHEVQDGPTGVQGRTLIHPESKVTPFMKTKELLPDLTRRKRTGLSPYHVITRNLSIRAEDLWAVGGFDEDFPGYGWEDIELGLRLAAHGVQFFSDPEALGYHYDVETLDRTREKLRQAGEGAVYWAGWSGASYPGPSGARTCGRAEPSVELATLDGLAPREARLVSWIAPWIPRGASVLDIGAGSGLLGEAMIGFAQCQGDAARCRRRQSLQASAPHVRWPAPSV